jgi:chitodextrinase
MQRPSRRRRVTLAVAGFLAAAAAATTTLVAALPASAATLCDQFATVVAGNYVIMNNRWGTSATQCINTTANGFSIIQQDGVGNTSGAPVSYPAIYLGCHYQNCSPNSPLPRQISTIGSAPTSISYSYPSSGTYNASFDIWLDATNNDPDAQDTEIMIWFNRQGSIQPIGSATGSANLAGRSWQVWTGNNGQNNVVSYLFQGSPIGSLNFDLMAFVNDTLGRGSQYGNNNWYLTSVQGGFEPWIGGVGLTVNSFSSSVSGGTQPPPPPPPPPPGTPGTPTASNVTSSSVTLNWSASSGTVSNYQIERATGATSTNFSQVGTSTSTSFTNSGLAANTTYRYRVRATNSAGTSGYSAITNVTTQSGQTTQPPGTPGTPTASNVTSSAATLSWSASSGTVSNYQIERATGATSTSFSQVGTSTSTSFTNTGLAANTTYRYRVRATNSAGTSAYSGITNVTTTSGGGTGGCTLSYRVVNPWGGAFQGEVVITNTGSTTFNGWTGTLNLGGGATITQMWGGTYSPASGTVTIRPMDYTRTVGPGQSVAVGFIANVSGSSGATGSGTCTSP